MLGSRYSEEDRETMRQLKSQGLTNSEIAKKLGRSEKAIQLQFFKMKKVKRGPKPGPRKKADYTPEVQAVTVSKKPMIAFVGEHADIVSAIKELFA